MDMSLAEILALMGAASAIFLAWKKAPVELSQTKTDTASKQIANAMLLVDQYKDSNEKTMAQYDAVMGRNEKLEEKIAQLDSQLQQISDAFAIRVSALEKENESLHQENEDLKGRITRLEAQIVSLGAEPVTQKRKPI